MSAKLLNLLSESEIEKLKGNAIEAGSVYLVRLTEKHAINTQGKEYRDKFVVVIGSDSETCYGILLINTKLGFPETEQYELKCASYKYLDHNSFVNCSTIKHIDRRTIVSGKNKGKLFEDDFRLIVDCARNSRLITNKDKCRYGLI
jgi:hypothetical protein